MPNATMTFAKNPVMSTLKYGAKTWADAGKSLWSAWKGGAGASIWDRVGKAGSAGIKSLEGGFFGGSKSQMAGVAGVGAAGAIGVGAGLDLVNPWGIGWGD
jgi:hypothetical protein